MDTAEITSELLDAYTKYRDYAAKKAAMSSDYEIEREEDLVQDTILRLWDKRSKLNIEYSVDAYFKRALRNVTIDNERKDKYRRIELNQLIAEEVPMTYLHPTNDLEQLKRILFRTVRNLPQKCREVFILSRKYQLSYKEIAERTGVSCKTVETHISRALRDLRQNLKFS
ncbi:MAG: sigma-70 family RNA polymerase sigma factor [Cyclobacteriaceae bacterium]|nr:sigma-70 family RNA polymerase sigma factor [Cyclobacteriaceae bacterium HetDA_MAG_MS6]